MSSSIARRGAGACSRGTSASLAFTRGSRASKLAPHWLALALLVLASASAVHAAEPPLALLPVVSDGLPSDQVTRVERVLRAAAERTFGARLQKEALTRARLEASEARGLGCDRGTAFRRPLVPDCLVATGVGVETEHVLAVRATRSETRGAAQVRVEALLFHVVDAKPIRRVVRRIALTDDAMNDFLARLFDDELAGAVLSIKGAPSGATLSLDGAEPAPLVERLSIEAGAHRLALTFGGTVRFHEIDVESGTQVELDANAASTLPTPPAAVSADAAHASTGASAATRGDGSGGTARLIAIGAGVGVSAIGGVLIGVGVIPRVGYSSDAVALARLQSEVADDSKKQHAAASDIRAKRASLEGNAQAWETWGVPLVVIGSSMVCAGVAAAAAFALAPLLEEDGAAAGSTEPAP